MTLETFSQIFGLLAVQLRCTDADEATIRGYYEALKDLEPELVAMAAQRMGKLGGGLGENPHWFPKSSEWRQMVAKVDADRTAELQARLRKLPTPLCVECADTGWRGWLDGRVSRCDCRTLRRLEVLGCRPMPQLPESTEAP